MKRFAVLLLIWGLPIVAALAGSSEDLMEAARQGDVLRVQRLINQGVDVNFTNEQGQTPLLVASQSGNRHTVRMLLSAGADIKATDNNGNYVLLAAVYSRNELLVRDLIGMGVDLNARDTDGATPLTVAGRLAYDPVIELLQQAGARGELRKNKLRRR